MTKDERIARIYRFLARRRVWLFLLYCVPYVLRGFGVIRWRWTVVVIWPIVPVLGIIYALVHVLDLIFNFLFGPLDLSPD